MICESFIEKVGGLGRLRVWYSVLFLKKVEREAHGRRTSKLHAHANLREKVEWEVRFWGSGRRDRRVGDAVAAFEAMRRAALDPAFILEARI